MENFIENIIYNMRWLLTIIYLGLSISLISLIIKFFQISIYLIINSLNISENELILLLLSLIDITLIGGLLIMIALSSYENFISKININKKKNKLYWLGKLDSSSLKNKVSSSIVAISSIHLLSIFMEIKIICNIKILLYIIIHITFLFSFFILSYLDKKLK
ncbi:hypothetical protein C3B56_00058 [Candidatus Annandia adelgestsuga]|uniref:UPF0114 protein C3B56_00058 n=1 Tax=Candidatus Annandia adelgestsuga TaxID=1302411 RepID=A0A3S9J7G6_9ENTR|nr:TIGR00645 family protein [Candidatus Annandia adelgestsuga]AZP36182.1 hypothetical protein C3B56_00058 [Candidatus Annandia adelgestsuga]